MSYGVCSWPILQGEGNFCFGFLSHRYFEAAMCFLGLGFLIILFVSNKKNRVESDPNPAFQYHLKWPIQNPHGPVCLFILFKKIIIFLSCINGYV